MTIKVEKGLSTLYKIYIKTINVTIFYRIKVISYICCHKIINNVSKEKTVCRRCFKIQLLLINFNRKVSIINNMNAYQYLVILHSPKIS